MLCFEICIGGLGFEIKVVFFLFFINWGFLTSGLVKYYLAYFRDLMEELAIQLNKLAKVFK